MRINRRKTMRIVATAAGIVTMVALFGFGLRTTADHNPTATTSSGPVSPVTAPTVPLRGDAAGLLTQLVIAPEDTGAHYDRTRWGEGWDYHRDSGCDTRDLVLLDQSTDHSAQKGKGCTPVCPMLRETPCWTSPYDGGTWRHEDDLEVDHRVSLKDANRSRVIKSDGTVGLGAGRIWDDARKHAFYEDRRNHVAVTATVNGAKSHWDAARWKPPLAGAWCDFAKGVAATKITWRLTVDQAEHDALKQMLGTCPTG